MEICPVGTIQTWVGILLELNCCIIDPLRPTLLRYACLWEQFFIEKIIQFFITKIRLVAIHMEFISCAKMRTSKKGLKKNCWRRIHGGGKVIERDKAISTNGIRWNFYFQSKPEIHILEKRI